MSGLLGSISLFTRIRVGRTDRVSPRTVLAWGSVVGALIGVCSAAVFALTTTLVAGPYRDLLAAVAAIALAAYLTRGLHLDGLADTADGLGSGQPPAQAMDVMHRSDIGPFGVVTIILVLGLQVSALAGLADAAWLVLPTAMATGRLAVLLACRPGVPAAPGSVLGAWVAGCLPIPVSAGIVAATTVAVATLGWWTGGAALAVGSALAVLAGCAMAAVMARVAHRRFGGISGDVLGACVEVAQTTTLLMLAVVM